MATRKVLSAKKKPIKKAASKSVSPRKVSTAKTSAKKKQSKEKLIVDKAGATKPKTKKYLPGEMETARALLMNTLVNKQAGKKAMLKCTTPKSSSRIVKVEKKARVFDSGRMAEHVEFTVGNESSVSVEALKIGLLLAAIDGNCDKNEVKKFKTVAKSCGGLSDAKIDQIVSQMQRRVSALEDAAKHGVSDDELVDKFMSEASNIGVRAECRNFVLWMSIAMVDGEYSDIEQKAITALQQYANRHRASLLFLRSGGHEISDIFLKRCQMILSGIYKADSAGNKRLMTIRMKSLQTLIEIAEA